MDEDPPPAPVAEVDAGLVKELERLEEKSGDSEEIQETPEDGIIDDDAVENDGDGEAGSVKAEEDLKSGGTSEDVLASGWNNALMNWGFDDLLNMIFVCLVGVK